MFRIFKKSQAALEFLTTYGWAFLVILIMIGALAYFGILNPSKILPNRCSFGVEFQCLDYQIKDLALGDEFRIRLKNNGGELIDVTLITLAREDETAYAVCTTPPAFPQTAWKLSEVRALTWTGCTFNDLAAGSKGKILLTISYYTVSSGATFAREVKGEVFSSVLAS